MSMLLFVVGAGILQAVFLACLIFFHPRGDRAVNGFLASYILALCIPMFIPLIQHFFSWQVLLFLDPFLLLSAPALYLYVRSFKEKVTFRKALPHFLLFFLFIVFDYYIYVNLASRYPLSQQVPAEVIHHPSSMIRVVIRIGQMITYFFLAGRTLSSYQRSIQHLFSETSRINLAWVRWLVNGYFILTLIMALLYMLILKNPEQFALIVLVNTAIATPYLYAVTFKGITQPTLWQIRQGLDKEKVLQEIHHAEETELLMHQETEKILKPAQSPERTNHIVAGTIELMEEGKLYLQAELTLQELADKLKAPSYQVSQAINDGLQKTFYDLVNGYRVEEAKRLLLDPKSRTNKILAVAFDAGFNSKTTFNTVFKKFTGLTPSDFKEQHQQEPAEA